MSRDPQTRALPVEPLSDEAWARIGAGLRARLDAGEARDPRRRNDAGATPAVWLGGAGALVAAAAALWLLWGRPADAPQVTPAQAVQVVAHEHMQLAHAGDANIELSPRSALSVQGDETTGYVVRLQSGSARFSVPPRQGRPSFRVVAGELEVEVVGTRFEVSARERAVAVEEGTVQVHWAGKAHRVSAGQRWRLPRADEAQGVVEPQAVEAPAPQRVDPAQVRDAARRPAASPRRPQARPAPHGATAATPQQRFEAAASLEAREPEGALRAYRALSAGDGPWAANALFAAGRLQLERGHRREARALLQRYLRRFPAGPNRADAQALLKGAR